MVLRSRNREGGRRPTPCRLGTQPRADPLWRQTHLRHLGRAFDRTRARERQARVVHAHVPVDRAALHYGHAEGVQGQGADRQRRHRKRRRTWLRHRVRRRDRRAGLALLHRPGQSGRRLRERHHEDGGRNLDRRLVGARGRRPRVARDAPTTKSWTPCTSAPATAAPWNQKVRSPEGGDNLFLCSDRRARPRHRRVQAGTTRPHPARPGTTTPTWTSCSPT